MHIQQLSLFRNAVTASPALRPTARAALLGDIGSARIHIYIYIYIYIHMSSSFFFLLL